MKDIEFMAAFGDDRKRVRISRPQGSSSGYQVFIANYYQGIIVKLNNEWVGHLNARSELTSDDILILGDIIDNASQV